VGSTYGLSKGRHVRINTPNIIKIPATQQFIRGPNVTGEGVYQCYNTGKLLSFSVPLLCCVLCMCILCWCCCCCVIFVGRCFAFCILSVHVNTCFFLNHVCLVRGAL
jgi:hypothetical protein